MPTKYLRLISSFREEWIETLIVARLSQPSPRLISSFREEWIETSAKSKKKLKIMFNLFF
ncbi:hypothetical protein LEP1GSC035_3470 [Leptospira noguchii str. 2007001578]|uniref:Uncharacterized protein n=1 Tax=Leptospira noguchii str. 2007001578 TaxID=1049974 RepID=A0ABN0IW09_9LEPT|nr:hypothetical protein LEP1GSC035_3470 [Leptospira noguchii str. 2007001578]